jgi:hypothetical protein
LNSAVERHTIGTSRVHRRRGRDEDAAHPAADAARDRLTERSEMAYGVVHRFVGGTKEQYEASLAAVHPNGGRDLPDGQIFHAAGPSQEGWTIVAIHESRESWERFRDDTLMPRLQGGIEGGFASPPQETTFEVENQQTA